MKTSRLVNLSILLVVVISLVGGASTVQAAPDVIYVDLDATGGANNGTSWGDAFVDLQSALAVAVAGDEIWVAEGVYYPAPPASSRGSTFQLKSGVAIYGGFDGSESNRDERDWMSHVTVLDGDIDRNGSLDDGNVHHVVTGSATDSSAVLDGFTITGGNANISSYNWNQGGGLYSNGGSPTLSNLLFSGNAAPVTGGSGGGMLSSGGGSPTLTNVTFSDNSGYAGGGMRISGGSPTLTEVTFANNSATGWGGGLVNDGATTMIDVTFTGNSAADNGGGMTNMGGSGATLIDVTFTANTAGRGGGMFIQNSILTLFNVVFYNNTATTWGGGMLIISSASPTLINVTFSANDAGVGGGAIRNTQSSSPILTNTILWGNTPAPEPISNDLSSTIAVTNSIVQGGYTGEGNLDLDPLFMDAGVGDLRLQSTSPAIDAGDNSALPADTHDLDGDGDTGEPIPFDLAGNPRIYSSDVDLGAYEASSIAALTVDSLNEPGDGICDSVECTLREAMAILAPGGTIDFDTGLSGGVITLGSQLTIDRDLTIDGSSLTPHVIISGGDSVRVFFVNNAVTAILNGLDVVHGSSTSGGGILNNGTLTIIDSVISNNSAPSGGGGAIINLATLAISGSTFSGNSALQGGAINNQPDSTLTVINSTFFGNSTISYGGGIANNAALAMTNSTFSGNGANVGGGGLYNASVGTLNLINTVLADSTAGGDCVNDGAMGTDLNNLIEDNAGCGSPVSMNDPDLGPLQDNGGSTPTMSILYTSPAFDAGDDALCPATDQRGVSRPLGSACDIGAYEANPAPFVVDDSATMLKDAPVIIDVLANDTGSGGPLSVESFNQPRFGSVTDNADDTLTYTPQADFYGEDTFTYIAIDSVGGSGTATVTLVPEYRNDTWTRAYDLQLSSSEAIEQLLDRPYQSRWLKFDVPAGSEIMVSLSDLPANYDLTLYTDIAATYRELDSPEDLLLLSAEFAPDMFSPDMFSPDMFSPDMFSPDMFSPDMFSPDMFSPDMFSPDMFSPDMFSPDMFSPDMFSPDMFSPDMFSPDMFSPDPTTFASAQLRSMIAVSASEGTVDESIRVNSWNNSGTFYIRVSGNHGAYDPDELFHLELTVFAGVCEGVDPSLPPSDNVAINGNYKTIVISDPTRMAGDAAEKAALEDSINAFIGRTEVAGVLVDVSSDTRVAAANTLADANPGCPYAKNLVAEAIKGIIDDYRQVGNPLEYVVIIGNDDVISFFRYPDDALLANEMDYSPPVLEGSASQASLKLGYILGQDEYGSQITIVQGGSTIPLPGLAVGRLVETPAEIMNMISLYNATQDGVLGTPTTALVTGYDFLADAAVEIESELQIGLGEQNPGVVESWITDRLIAPQLICTSGASFDGQCSWTADQVWDALLGGRHDIIFLAGHFTASSWLAPDNQSRMLTSNFETSAVDLENTLVFSAGCHSGYNIVNEHDVPDVTREPDWAQTFARQGATFIGGTGYQYGDTDFVEYSERLYLEFARQLRVGTGPVSIGQALVSAKQAYLSDTAEMSGIHEKALIEATLFGLPMLSIDLPYGRTTPETDPPIVSTTVPFQDNPGSLLNLRYADVVIDPELTLETVPLNNPPSDQATYLSGSDGVLSNPAQPVLPLEFYNVNVANYVLRGVGFRGGSFTDLPNLLPLTGAAATEIRGVHTPFISDYFFPVRLWNVNYVGALIGASGEQTRLAVLPAQYRSSSGVSTTGTMRRFENLEFRLYYSANTASYSEYDYVPAQAAPPLIANISAAYDAQASEIDFQATVVGDPTAGIQEVWVVYTLEDGQASGTWLPFDLIQDETDSRLWTGSLTLQAGASPSDLRYVVQAVNGVGVVAYATNLGVYYTPGEEPGAAPPANQAPTELTINVQPSKAYGESVTVSATLTSEGDAVSGEVVVISLGPQRRLAITDTDGHAQATFLVLGSTGETDVSVSLKGTEDYAASAATGSFTITKQATHLFITPDVLELFPVEEGFFVATLMDDGGHRLPGKSLLFEVHEVGSGDLIYAEAIETDYTGQSSLILPAQPVGQYTISARFGGPGLQDPHYLDSTVESTLKVVVYEFNGFFPPVDNTPVVNIVKAGRAIPVKFSLNGDQGLDILDGAPIVMTVDCQSGDPTNDVTETTTAGASSLTYDPIEDQYIYVWKTDKSWAGTCLQLIVHLVDGTEHIAYFRFK